jgi:signal transduction histidine kinase
MLEEAAYLEMEIGSLDELLGEANRLLLQQYLTVEGLLRENRKLQQQITRDQMKRVAMDSLRNVAMTLNQHINNATATILGRAQLVELAIKRGQITDSENKLSQSMRVISNGVETIGAVMKDLTNLAYLEASQYSDPSPGVDIEARIRRQLEQIEVGEPVN